MSEMSDDIPKKEEELSHMKGALERTPLNLPDDIAANVMRQFQRDLDNPLPCQYDFEFISAYFDRELHSEFPDHNLLKQRIESFEQHLPHCPSCNQQLGQLSELTDIYRNYLYSMEIQLKDFDISERVMSILRKDVVSFNIKKSNVSERSFGKGRKQWFPLAATAVAASVLIFVFSTRLSPPQESYNSNESLLSESINGRTAEANLLKEREESPTKKRNDVVLVSSANYIYQSPEAYLFSSESDILLEGDLAAEDVSVVVLNTYP